MGLTTDPLEGFQFFSSQGTIRRRVFWWSHEVRIKGALHPDLRRVFRGRSRAAVEAAADEWIESLRHKAAVETGERFLREYNATRATGSVTVEGRVRQGDQVVFTDTGQKFLAGKPWPDPDSGCWTTPLTPVGKH